MKGMGNMMKQAQKLQSKMMKMQEELAGRTVEATSGGGMVKVVDNGKQQVMSIVIEKEVVDPEDIEMLQDLILAAVNDDELRTLQEPFEDSDEPVDVEFIQWRVQLVEHAEGARFHLVDGEK